MILIFAWTSKGGRRVALQFFLSQALGKSGATSQREGSPVSQILRLCRSCRGKGADARLALAAMPLLADSLLQTLVS